MGQISSNQLQDFFQTTPLSKLLNDDPNSEKSIIFEEIHAMTYEDFLAKLKELNNLSQTCLDSSKTKTLFAVKKGTDSTLLWKATVQIACVKLDSSSDKVETFRLLNLREFLQVFKTLKCQYSAVQQSRSSDEATSSKLTASSLFENIEEASKSKDKESQSECIICLERKPDISLPCAHSYCLECIEEWNEDHDTCPICREKLESTDDTWVISDVPKAEEISEEIRTTLMDLAEDKSPPCSPS